MFYLARHKLGFEEVRLSHAYCPDCPLACSAFLMSPKGVCYGPGLERRA